VISASGTYYYAVTAKALNGKDNPSLVPDANFTVNGLPINIKLVNPIKIKSINARIEKSGVLVSWKISGEQGTRRYRLFRTEKLLKKMNDVSSRDILLDIDIIDKQYMDKTLMPGKYYYGLLPGTIGDKNTGNLIPGVNITRLPLKIKGKEEKGQIEPDDIDWILKKTFFKGNYRGAIKALQDLLDNSDNEEGFRVEGRSREETDYHTIASLPKDSANFTDEQAPIDKSYYYRVIAFNSYGESVSAWESIRLGFYSIVEKQNIQDYDMIGGILYLLWNDGLSIFDTSDPKFIKFKKTIELRGYVRSGLLKIHGTSMYVIDDDKLFTLDITDPLNPIILSEFDLGGTSIDIESIGNTVFILSSDYSLNVIDSHNQKTPKTLKTLKVEGSPHNLAVDNSHLFISNAREGIFVYDIKNPDNPKLAAKFSSSPPRYYNTVTIWGDKLIASVRDFENEVHIIDVNDPLKMYSLGKSTLNWIPLEIAAYKNFFFIPEAEAGLEIVWAGDIKRGKVIGSIESEIDKVKIFDPLIMMNYQNRLYVFSVP